MIGAKGTTAVPLLTLGSFPVAPKPPPVEAPKGEVLLFAGDPNAPPVPNDGLLAVLNKPPPVLDAPNPVLAVGAGLEKAEPALFAPNGEVPVFVDPNNPPELFVLLAGAPNPVLALLVEPNVEPPKPPAVLAGLVLVAPKIPPALDDPPPNGEFPVLLVEAPKGELEFPPVFPNPPNPDDEPPNIRLIDL